MCLAGWQRLCALFFVFGLVGVGARAAPESEPSHAERFASPEAKLRRAEQEGAARLRSNPKDVQALLERGQARLRLGQLNPALDDFHRAAALDPASADVQAHLAYGLWMQGQFQPALNAARAALARDPENASAHRYAGRLLLLVGGDRQLAIRHLQRAVELNPEETDARFDLLTAYRAVGDVERAWAQLRLLRTAYPAEDTRLLHAEGLLGYDQGRVSFAIDRFRQALAVAPNSSEAREGLGVALVQAERWPEAVAALAQLAKEQPQSFKVAYLYALALENTQSWPEAEREARRALKLDPKSADAQALLDQVLAKSGEVEKKKE